jgi:DNA-binding NarL/FixJ family response regulator
MIKIAIIDPHPIVRCGFQNFFRILIKLML